ncbi:small ribosomal subunit protein uS15m [Carettochelys insculpta]|uniref:small ribosomal subunit protein uS15m n=1 Tax=Carettochelys insculpta TaxID=44489 RepID=UPI003EBFC511
MSSAAALSDRLARSVSRWRRPCPPPRRALEMLLLQGLRGALGWARSCRLPGASWSRGIGGALGLQEAGERRSVYSPLLQTARCYARPVKKRKKALPSHLDDLHPTMLKKDYANVPVIDKVDDVVKRLLSLEMASQREKVRIKTQQLVEKIRRTPSDSGSFEVQTAILTAKIQTLQEHLHMHPKDKSNRRCMLMAIDRRKKLLKYLRRTQYDIFERTCQQLGIQYTFPPPYCRRMTRRWVAKKAFCLKVFKEVQKLKASERLKQRREWQAKARAAKEQALRSEGTPV